MTDEITEHRVEIKREPLTYERNQNPEARTSYFRDLGTRERDDAARARLNRHAEELRAVAREPRLAPESLGLEYRVTPNRTDGQGGYFSPPLWITAAFAMEPRPGAVLTRLIPSFELPEGVSTVNIPKVTTGVVVGVTGDAAPSPIRDVTDAPISQPVATFSGTSDWALQNLEQSPIPHLDWTVFTELTDAYYAQVERQLLIGSGKGEEFAGMLNVAGITKVVNGGAIEATKMFPLIGRTMAQIGVKRKRQPEALLMNTSRLMWLGTSEDTANRPLLLTDFTGSDFPISSLTGVGVFLDDAIPQNLGTAENQDVIIATRPKDFIYLESVLKTGTMMEPLSGELGVRFQLHAYATVLYRYPTAISVLEGTGMEVAEGFH